MHTLAEIVPDKLFGLPAHPLIVHMPVVMVPLAAIGALLALARPQWRGWALPVTAVLALGGLVGVQLAIWSGQNLESSGEESALVERHSQLAAQARPMVFIFVVFAALAAWTALVARRTRPGDGPGTPAVQPRAHLATRLLMPVCALSLLTGALATTWIVRTGHSGAKSVWSKSDGTPEGGDHDGQ